MMPSFQLQVFEIPSGKVRCLISKLGFLSLKSRKRLSFRCHFHFLQSCFTQQGVPFQKKLKKKKRWGRVGTPLPHTLIPNRMGFSIRNFYSSIETLIIFHYLVFKKWAIVSSGKPAERGQKTIKTLVLMINKFSAKYFSLFNYFTSLCLQML